MKPSQLDLLLLLAEEGALGRSIPLTTTQAAARLGVSQQTISRWLQSLFKEGLVSRTPLGLRLSSAVRLKFERVKNVFARKPGLSMEGLVVDGLRDGAYYMSQPEYRKQFKLLLGFEPYAGTLNLRLASEQDLAARSSLDAKQGILIKGFKRSERVFGDVKCFRARLNGRADCAVIMPVRTHHADNTLEVIAVDRLRDRLRLKNGSRVVVEVEAEN